MTAKTTVSGGTVAFTGLTTYVITVTTPASSDTSATATVPANFVPTNKIVDIGGKITAVSVSSGTVSITLTSPAAGGVYTLILIGSYDRA